MKKFTNLGNINKTVNLSDNRQDFIKNLIEESLTIQNGEIIGKDILSNAINKILDINESKTKISVLENIKLLSTRGLNLQLINESIELEKNNMNNIKSDNTIKKEEPLQPILEKKCGDKNCDDKNCDCNDESKRGESDEDDDKIKKDDHKQEETEVTETVKKIYVIDGDKSTGEIEDLAKIIESINSSDEDKKKINVVKVFESNEIIMNDEEWINVYKPQNNHINKDRGFNGWLYETYGEEAEYVKSMIDSKCVWSIEEGEKNGREMLYYRPLMKWDDQYMGFFVTDVPHNGKNILVEDDVTPDE